ncbi:MAG: DinB family protein [Chloroflexi bacterium]|nr:DinB family protein [Chloroflexota bacterium]
MTNAAAQIVANRLREAQKYVLTMTGKVDDAQLRWHANAVSPSIAFHLWHLGRWADRVQSTVPGLTPSLGERLGSGTEIWDVDGIAAAWGFDESTLGNGRTGSGMTDADAQALPFPPREVLLGYVERAFQAVERAFAAIDDEQFVQSASLTTAHGPVHTIMVGEIMTSHLAHVSRHLGMIEALIGVLGAHGTATM